MKISIIVAVSKNGVIGSEGGLPWHIPEDLKRFKKITQHHPVIMGRKTYESIGKILPQRENIIITRQKDYHIEGAAIVHSFQDALELCQSMDTEEVFVIGGESIYREALKHLDRIYLTRIHREYEGESTFPEIVMDDYTKILEEAHGGDPPFSFLILDRKR
jgi:dihydrofolate reductase